MAKIAVEKSQAIICDDNIIERDEIPSMPRSQDAYAHVRQLSGYLNP